MFLQIPGQFVRSITYIAKCNKVVYTLHYLVYVLCYLIQLHLEKKSENTWWDILTFMDIVLDLYVSFCFPIMVYDGMHADRWAFAIGQARNGNTFYFIPALLSTSVWTALSSWHVTKFYHTFKNCEFGFMYFAFLRSTLGGTITGIIAALFCIAFTYLVLLDITFFYQACNLYRNLRDDCYRRRG